MNAIECKEVEVKKGSFLLKNISMCVPKGTVVGLVGKNGSGKTTLIRTLARVEDHRNGYIRYDDLDFAENLVEIRQKVGFVFDKPWFSITSKPIALSSAVAPFYPHFDMDFFNEQMKKMDLPQYQALNKYSAGMLKKFMLVFVLAMRPETLVLDEPTSEVDPISRNDMIELLLDFMQDEKHSILFSTHITSDLDKIADYIIMLDRGEIVLNEEKNDLIERFAKNGRVLPDIEEIMVRVNKEGAGLNG